MLCRPTPIKFNEKSRPGAQMLCSSFSPGNSFSLTLNLPLFALLYSLCQLFISGLHSLTFGYSVMLSSSTAVLFVPGGGFLVAGSSDNIIRVYQLMPAPIEKIAELTAHCVSVLLCLYGLANGLSKNPLLYR